MKKTIIAAGFAIIFAASVSAFAQEADKKKESPPWLVSLTANYGSWSAASVDNNGNQSVGMMQMAYTKDTWGAAVTGKGVRTSYKTTADPERLDLSTFTDTDVSTFYNYKKGKWTLRGGLDLSLPTGKHSYTSAEVSRIILDNISQDLMLMNTYGAGANVIPHLMAVYQASSRFTIGAGMRYEFTGEYTPVSDNTDKLNPGDRLLAVVNGAYIFTERDITLLTLSYSHLGEDKQNGSTIFRKGDVYSLEGRYIRKWSDLLTSIASLSLQKQEKNEALSEGSVLNSELNNSNSNLWEFFVNNIYKLSDRFSLTGTGGYKTVAANGYKMGDSLYDGGRWKLYAEPGVIWYLSDNLYATGKLRYTYLYDYQDAFSPSDTSYNVYNIDLGLVMSF